MPQRTEIFNLADAAVEIYLEDPAGGSPTSITDYLFYVGSAPLTDAPKVVKIPQVGRTGFRVRTVEHDYALTLTRFYAKSSEDFDITGSVSVNISTYQTYQIKLVYTNAESPTLTETHTLTGCQLNGRAIKTNLLENTVSLSWTVGDYIPPA
jgi:hypothetical protein